MEAGSIGRPPRPDGVAAPATRSAWIAPLAVAAAFAVEVVASWRRLGSLVVDTGRELDVPARLLRGDALYADVRYYWGPLAPWLNAALYRLFGVSIDVLMVAGIASAALACAALYLLACEYLERWLAAVVAIAFLALCAFPQLHPVAIFNFVLPFNFSATYGMVLALWSLHLLVVHARTGRAAPLLASVGLLALTAFTKLEVLLAAGAAHACFLGLAAASRGAGRLRRAHVLAHAVAAALVAAVYAALRVRVGPALWEDNLGALFNEGSRHYVRETMGLTDVAGGLAQVGESLAALGAALWIPVRLGAWLERRGGGSAQGWLAPLAIAALAAAAYAAIPLHVAFAALPLVMGAAVAALLVVHARGGRDVGASSCGHLLLWAFALACTARIPLRSGPTHYGFFLLPAGLVCLGVLFRDHAQRVTRVGPVGRRLLTAAGVGLLAGTTIAALRVSSLYFTEPRVELATRRGRLLVREDAPELFVNDVLRLYPASTRVAAVPVGAGMVFAAGLSDADGFSSYLPMELPDAAADLRLLETWRRRPPDLVVWQRADARDAFGYQGFGIDYAVATARWVAEHYRPITDPSAPVFVLGLAR